MSLIPDSGLEYQEIRGFPVFTEASWKRVYLDRIRENCYETAAVEQP